MKRNVGFNQLKHFFFLFFIFLPSLSLKAQEIEEEILEESVELLEPEEVTKPLPKKKFPVIKFAAHPQQTYGFDALECEAWNKEYSKVKVSPSVKAFPVSYKSVQRNETDRVLLTYKGLDRKDRKQLIVILGDSLLPVKRFNDTSLVINLPRKKSNYVLKAYFNEDLAAKLIVQVHQEIREKVILIPLVPFGYSSRDIQYQVNKIYSQSGIFFDLRIDSPFKHKVFEPSTVFSTPIENHTQYTGQMRLLRDLYLEEHPSIDRNAYFIFIVEGFQDSLLRGFMAKNKSIGFVTKTDSLTSFCRNLAQTLALGSGALEFTWIKDGPPAGTTLNLMDTMGGLHLTHFQWTALRKSPNYYSLYDNDENIRTNNGRVAYYFWNEDQDGNIDLKNLRLMEAIHRPYKHNFLSYRFKIKYFILRPIYKIGNYFVSVLDIIFSTLTLLILWYIRRKIRLFWKKKRWKHQYLRRILFSVIIIFTGYQIYENYWITNRILYYFKEISGPLTELGSANLQQARHELMNNDLLFHEEISSECSEILIFKNKQWFVKKRAKVLYLDVLQNEKGEWNKARFASSSDSILLSSHHYAEKATGHYLVFNYKRMDGGLEKQEIVNHAGENILVKIQKADPPKRILLFVNGYRPTSIGQTFEENFSDVQINGLEYPDSKNFIYDFDRFDYWRPWGEINLQFQKRLNPTETYYADGHFAVSTSNYRSLINFSSISSVYPKRCSNPKKHTCFTIQDATWMQFLLNDTKTINQLKMRPNHKGFQLRKNKGKIAGRNLIQVLNKVPGRSLNDTLYIIAHSMGFAYSQGIVEVLRGKINFGGYYIIAPENGQSGKIRIKEWQEAWQYGSNFNEPNQDAPCLQDGIAPQYTVPGLPKQNRIFIPEQFYTRKGFFDSHFIGYYNWILDIEPGNLGHISLK